MASAEIEKFVKKANICFLKDFLEAAVKCGELTEIGKERLKENRDLKEFFDEGRDELVETLHDTAKELSSLKARIKGDGLEYLLEDPHTDDNFDELLEECSDDFIQISFRGSKEGYTFKTDAQGTGYYKDGATFEESSEEEDLTECGSCHRVWDGNAQCPCGMGQEQETFEGRTTFPTENTNATNQFILRYIAKKWQGLTYRKVDYRDGGDYSISYPVFPPNSVSGEWLDQTYPTYTLNGKGSCGIMSMDGGWGIDGFIIDLKGKEIKVINNFLKDLIKHKHTCGYVK